MSSPIRILVVDDHPALRDGVTAMLSYEQDMVVCGQAADGMSAIDSYRVLRPDITLMDLRMPDMGGAEAIRGIRKLDPGARIIVLTTYKGDMDAREALSAGALGYLLKSAIREELISCVRAALAGQRRIAAPVAAAMASHFTDDALSPRELDVLGYIATGTGNRSIADAMHISTGTVKDHVSRILAKLGAQNRAHAVAIAISRGILRPD